MPMKIFTDEQSIDAIPYIDTILRDIKSTYATLTQLRGILDSATDRHPGLESWEFRYEQLMIKLGELNDELVLIGVELRDFQLPEIAIRHIKGDKTYTMTYSSASFDSHQELVDIIARAKSMGLIGDIPCL